LGTPPNAAPGTGNLYMAPSNAMGVPSSLYGAVSLLALSQSDTNTLLGNLFAAPTNPSPGIPSIPYYILAPTTVRSE
jgi:hypothetical protein